MPRSRPRAAAPTEAENEHQISNRGRRCVPLAVPVRGERLEMRIWCDEARFTGASRPCSTSMTGEFVA